MTNGLHEFINHVIVLLALQTLLWDANVEGVVEQFLVIRSNIEDNRHDTMRRNATGGTVKRQFADGNAHTLSTKIAKAQNAATIRNYNDVNVRQGPVVDHRSHVSTILLGEVHTTRPAIPTAEFLACLSNSWGVDQGSNFFNVIDDDAMIQRLIAIMKILEHNILEDHAIHLPQGLHKAFLLNLQIVGPRREQSSHTKPVPLSALHGHALVDCKRIVSRE